MEKQTIILVDGKFEYILHEYMTDKGLILELKYSNSEGWSEHIRETTAIKLLDDGNGIKFLTKHDSKRIDYHVGFEWSIIMQVAAMKDYKVEFVKYKGYDSE